MGRGLAAAVCVALVWVARAQAAEDVTTIDPATCPTKLCKLVAYGRASDLRFPDFTDLRGQLAEFYEPEYKPAWIDESGPTKQARAMIALLRASTLKGLKPEDYNADLWDQQIEHFDHSQFDVVLTVSLLRYLADLHYGKASAGFFHLDRKYRDFDMAAFLRGKLMNADDAEASIAEEVEPPFAAYKGAERALAEYLTRASEADVAVPDEGKTVEPGASYANAGLLARRLEQLGDLPRGSTIPSNEYSGVLIEAVKRFQARHGIEADGRIGNATLEQLNTPLKQRVAQILMTMERWRWAPHTFRHAPIVVNIPEFTLRTLTEANTTGMQMKVVVGSSYETQTPVFYAELGYLTFRPYWNVPASILENEMIAKLAQERDYLSVHGYELLNAADRPIPAPKGLTDAMLRGLGSGRYRIRQVPGPNCALGLLRFGIPNEHNVYLHDTPSHELFALVRRDFSHGCVRVEKPVELAEWCLRGTNGWDAVKIRRAMDGTKTFQVNLAEPIPVLLMYATAIAGEDGAIHFTPDIYGQDALLENRMAQGYPSRLSGF